MGISACYFCLRCGAVFTTEFDKSQHLEKEVPSVVHIDKDSPVEQVVEHTQENQNEKVNSTSIEPDKEGEYDQLSEFLRILYAA